jgi:putative membrane protein
MMQAGYHYWGMHLFWWCVWGVVLIWIFAVPYNIPGQRVKKESPIEILKRRLASGEISNEEYIEKRKILDI